MSGGRGRNASKHVWGLRGLKNSRTLANKQSLMEPRTNKISLSKNISEDAKKKRIKRTIEEFEVSV